MVRVLTLAVVVLNVAGNSFLRAGMSSVGRVASFSPLDYARAFANMWVALGVVLLIGWMVAQLSLLSWADLSYVLPVTSLSYILSTLAGALLLHERVTAVRWAAIALVFAGVVVVGRTNPRTGPPGPGERR